MVYRICQKQLKEKYGDIFYFRSSHLKFGGFYFRYGDYGRTHFDSEIVSLPTIYTKTIYLHSLFLYRQLGLASSDKNYEHKYSFAELVDTITHELAH